MITLESHGTMTRETGSLMHWRAAVDEIVARSLAGCEAGEIDRTVTRARLARWYDDGMTVAMAAGSVASWVRAARPRRRADEEAAALRRRLAGVRS